MKWKDFNQIFSDDIASTSSTWYHKQIVLRLSKFITFLSYNLNINPDTLTLVSTGLAILGVLVIIFFEKSFIIFLVNLLCLQFSFALDSADGQLARMQNKSTLFGKFLDIILDRVNNFILFIGFGLSWIKYDNGVSADNILLYVVASSIFILYTVISMVRGFIFDNLSGLMQNYGKGVKQYILKIPYQFMNQGSFSLILSISYLFSVIYHIVLFYGFISLLLIVIMVYFVKLRG